MLNSLYSSIVSETQKNQKRIENIIAITTKELKAEVATTPFEVLGKFGRCRLLYYSPKADMDNPPLFIVPSIINKYYILDLMKGASFIEHLKNANVPVYLLDWGEPRTQDRLASIEDHVLHWLDWAVRESCRHANVESLDLFGQCIGGTFASIYTALRPEKVKSLIAFTAPVSFHDEGLLSTWTNQGNINLELISGQWGNVYREFLKESFSMLKPLDRFRKYNNFFKHSWNSKFLDRYLAINTWVDDCIAFPGTTYVRYIQDFYQKNLLFKGELKVGDEEVLLSNINCPVFVIGSQDDEIVPFESAATLIDLVSSDVKELKQINGGHIGIVISSKAKENFWIPVEKWVKNEGCINEKH
jgi:polyhydroxyalkanoate synthase